MKLQKLFLLALAMCASAMLSAQTAKVIRMSGDQSATLINAAGVEIPLTVGMELSEGDLVASNANTKVFIRTFEGAITTLAADSVLEIVKVEKISDERELTRLRLQSGNVVANLDPNKRGIHDYSVDTPKGVAAARGTSYSVSVNGFEVLVTVSNGEVSFVIPDIPTPVVISPGNASSGGNSVTLAAALANPATAAAVSQAMQATAAAVATLMTVEGSGVTSATLNSVITAAASAGAGSGASGDNGALVAVVAAAATQANPAVASEVVQSAVVATAGTSAAQTVANTVVASVTRASTAATGVSVAVTAANLAQVVNTASNGNVTVDSQAVENSVNESISQESTGGEGTGTTETGGEETPATETEIEVEVPTDSINVTITSSFTIRLSGGRLVSVSLNDQNDNAEVALVTAPVGPETAEVGVANTSVTFAIPASVLAELRRTVLSEEQRANIVRGINNVIAGLNEVIVPTDNTITVSPSS